MGEKAATAMRQESPRRRSVRGLGGGVGLFDAGQEEKKEGFRSKNEIGGGQGSAATEREKSSRKRQPLK